MVMPCGPRRFIDHYEYYPRSRRLNSDFSAPGQRKQGDLAHPVPPLRERVVEVAISAIEQGGPALVFWQIERSTIANCTP